MGGNWAATAPWMRLAGLHRPEDGAVRTLGPSEGRACSAAADGHAQCQQGALQGGQLAPLQACLARPAGLALLCRAAQTPAGRACWRAPPGAGPAGPGSPPAPAGRRYFRLRLLIWQRWDVLQSWSLTDKFEGSPASTWLAAQIRMQRHGCRTAAHTGARLLHAAACSAHLPWLNSPSGR